MPNEYLSEVVERLASNPTAQDLDYFLVAHARIGPLAATARNLADEAEYNARLRKATEYGRARDGGSKSATDATERAIVLSENDEREAISAKAKAAKLSALHRSIEEVINGIKFLGRNDGTMTLPRR
jgi:hypothetical protein